MEDIALIMDILNKEQTTLTDDDIEKHLRQFHQGHEAPASHRSLWLRHIGIGVAAAAAIAATVVLVKPFDKTPPSSGQPSIAQNTMAPQTGNHSRQQSPGKSVSSTSNDIHEQEEAMEETTKNAMEDAKDKNHEEELVAAHLQPSEGQTQPEEPAEDDLVKLSVSKGHSYKVKLPDGSSVYLHPGSKMVYPRDFCGAERRVRLEGEAYFVVHKDKQHPFIVSTANSETLVTGTEFNVNTGDGSKPCTSVTLINGSVQLSNKQNQQRVNLVPGEEGIVRGNRPISVCEADTMKFVAWRDGYFYFDNTTLDDILRQICQSYDVQAVYSDRKLGNYRMHLALRHDQDLKEVVEMINKMKKVKVSLMYGKLYIQER